MKLDRNREITIKSWLNQTVISDEKWEIFSSEEDDTFYIFAKDPITGNELKLKIDKSIILENSEISSTIK